ncbi:unnamed protein product [Rhizophagus irregularis]|nr:unnamed protein product [Rhizophagus irregularis]
MYNSTRYTSLGNGSNFNLNVNHNDPDFIMELRGAYIDLINADTADDEDQDEEEQAEKVLTKIEYSHNDLRLT